MHPRGLILGCLFIAAAASCTMILGVDKDYREVRGETLCVSADDCLECSPWEQDCGGVCVDTTSDPLNCGACGNQCYGAADCWSSECVLTCSPWEQDCGGVCADTANDPLNCGACGHDCNGTTCSDSVCEPVVLAPGQSWPRGIAVDAEYVYWADANDATINRVPRNGGEPETLAYDQWGAMYVAVDTTHVYWTATKYIEYGTVMKVPRAGGPSVVLAKGQPFPYGIALDEANVYWTDPEDGTVMKVPKDGSAPAVPVAQAQGVPYGVAVGGGYVYWTNRGIPEEGGGVIPASGSLMRAPTGGGDSHALVPSLSFPGGVAVNEKGVFWGDHNGIWALQTPIDTSAPVQLVSAYASYTIALDTENVYGNHLFEGSNQGVLGKIPISGDTPTVMAWGSFYDLTGIAVDDDSIYWTDRFLGTVNKIPK